MPFQRGFFLLSGFMDFDIYEFIGKLRKHKDTLAFTTVTGSYGTYPCYHVGQWDISFTSWNLDTGSRERPSIERIEGNLEGLGIMVKESCVEGYGEERPVDNNLMFVVRLDEERDTETIFETFSQTLDRYLLSLELETSLKSGTKKEKRIKV